MDPWLIGALITVSGTGLVQVALERHRNQLQRQHQLVARMSAFSAALDALITEIEQLPDFVSPLSRRWMDLLERYLPSLDFLIGRLSRLIVGQDARRSVERLQIAARDLMPIAPPSVADQLALIFDLLGLYQRAQSGRDPGEVTKTVWLSRVSECRNEFGRLTRKLANPMRLQALAPRRELRPWNGDPVA